MPAETLQRPVCYRDESGVFHYQHELDTSCRELRLQRRDPTPEELSRLILFIRCSSPQSLKSSST